MTRRYKSILFAVLSWMTAIPAYADHYENSAHYGWWIPFAILISLGLAMVLWDEFVRSIRAATGNDS